MEVTHVSQFDTHAVLGGAKPQAFRMAETAEFFTVLSDTLYSNKKLAVVREVICNAWDAHIKAKRADRPVKITLTDKELMIEDCGPGIPEHAVVDIYCTYGKSTKVEDDEQTGGFGLGSKAPFAYTSHFTVTNRHNGQRTIYAVSRGSTQTQGKPDIRQMVRIPDDQTGVTVTIPLVKSEDAGEFLTLIERIVRQGEINATLNGTPIETIDLSLARKIGFTFASSASGVAGKGLNVRYGSVIYPVDINHAEVRAMLERFSSLNRNAANFNWFGKLIVSGDYSVILLAPPNSVGVTPSRESLSYTDVTLETLRGLIEKIYRTVGEIDPTATICAENRKLGKSVSGLEGLLHLITRVGSGGYYRPEFLHEDFPAQTERDLILTRLMMDGSKANWLDQTRDVLRGALKSKHPEVINIRSFIHWMLRATHHEIPHMRLAWARTEAFVDYAKMRRNATRTLRSRAVQCAALRDYDGCLHDVSSHFHELRKVNVKKVAFYQQQFHTLLVVDSKANYTRWMVNKRIVTSSEISIAEKINCGPDDYRVRQALDRELNSGALVLLLPKGKVRHKPEELAKALGIPKVEHLEVVKKKVEVETKLFDAADLVYNKHSEIKGDLKRFRLADKARSSEVFQIVIPCKPSVHKTALPYPTEAFAATKRIISYFDEKGVKVGIALTAVEKNRALKNGLTLLSDAVLEELRQSMKMKGFMARAMLGRFECIKRSFKVPGDNYGEFRNKIIGWLNCADHQLATEFQKMIFPWLPKLTPEEASMWRLYQSVISESGGHEVERKIRPMVLEIEKISMAMAKTGKMPMPSDLDILNQFPGILFVNNPNRNTNDLTPEILDLLKRIKIRGRSAAKTETGNV